MLQLAKSYKAFLFDLNGTVVNDMSYHIEAWHRILLSLGANIGIERTKTECYGKNGEMLERIFPGRFSNEEKEKLGTEKETTYRKEFLPHLKFINGFEAFLQSAHGDGIKTAIGSAAILPNIDFVVDGLNIRHLVDAIVSADDVMHSKPHPETFLKCAELLGINPTDCLVFEDAPKGVEAAQNAGMNCVVITTLHRSEEFSHYNNIVGFIQDYYDDQLTSLLCLKEKI